MVELICLLKSLLNDGAKIPFSEWLFHNFIVSHEPTPENTFLISFNDKQVIWRHFCAFFLCVYCIFFAVDDVAMKGILCEGRIVG